MLHIKGCSNITHDAIKPHKWQCVPAAESSDKDIKLNWWLTNMTYQINTGWFLKYRKAADSAALQYHIRAIHLKSVCFKTGK